MCSWEPIAFKSVHRELTVTDMIEPLAIHLRKRTTIHRAGEPLSSAPPSLQGLVKALKQSQLSSSDGTLFLSQSRPLAHWLNAAVCCVCVETYYPANNPLSGGTPERQASAAVSRGSGQSLSSSLKLTDRHEKACSARLNDNCQIRSKGLVTAQDTIYNPRRARHPGDLLGQGNPGSLQFGGMPLETDVTRSERYPLMLLADDPLRRFSANKRLSLNKEFRDSENWNCRNHINAEEKFLLRNRSCRLKCGHCAQDQGRRIEPMTEARTTESVISVILPHALKKFPSALEANYTARRAPLFPADKRETYELQGGGRKTQRVILDYGMPLEDLSWSHFRVIPSLPPRRYTTSRIFNWFSQATTKSSQQSLLQEGLDVPQNFSIKVKSPLNTTSTTSSANSLRTTTPFTSIKLASWPSYPITITNTTVSMASPANLPSQAILAGTNS